MKQKRTSLAVLLLIILSFFTGIVEFIPVRAQGGMEQVLFGGYNDLLDDGVIEYNSLVGGYTWTSVEETWRAKIVSTDGVLKQLRVKLSGSPGTGNKYTFALIVNGNPTALTLDISDLETSNSDMVTEVDVAGGNLVSLRCVPDSTPTEVYARWTIVFESDTACESLVQGGSGFALSVSDTEYAQVMGGSNYGTTEDNYRQVVPTGGTLKDFYVWLQMDPGNSPDAYEFTVRLNGETVAQSLIVRITADATTGFDLVHNLVVVAGDVLTMMVEPLNTPSVAPPAVWGMTFVSTINGESIVLGATSNNLPDTDTEYNSILPGHDLLAWSVGETSFYQLGQVCTLKKFHVLLSGFPGVENDYDFAIRIAGTNVVTLQISDGDITGDSGVLEDTVALDEYVTIRVIPTGEPTIRDAYWGFVCYISVSSVTTSWTFHTTSSSTTTTTTEETIETTQLTTTTTLSTTESTTIICATTQSTLESCTTIAGVGGTETLYVNEYNLVLEEWDETGSSPWLDDTDGAYISTSADDAWHDEFLFADSGVGVGTINSVYLYVEINGPSARNDLAELWLWGEAGKKKSLGWVNVLNQDPDGDNYVWYNVDVSTALGTWEDIDGAKLKVQYQKSGSPQTQTIYFRRAYLYVSYTGEASTSTVLTTITTCTTLESTTESTTTSFITTTPTTQTTTTEEILETPLYIWTVLQIVIDPCTTTTSTGACITVTSAETTTETECETECETSTFTSEETTCETTTITHVTECETTCETSTFTSVETECETETVTHVTECETICETETITHTTECQTECETSTFTSEETTCETETITHTTECETVCETSTFTSEETTCETSTFTSEETTCETTTVTHTTECETECETSTLTSEETTCETETVTHTTACETICETSTFTSVETTCETETITHTTACQTECETSTFTSEETTCETETITHTTECETICETSILTSEETVCETTTITHVTECETSCETSTFTSEETTCETETVTHTTECQTECETETETSCVTECETSTITEGETCETTCVTSTFDTTLCVTDYVTSTSTTDVDTSTVSGTSVSTSYMDTITESVSTTVVGIIGTPTYWGGTLLIIAFVLGLLMIAVWFTGRR